MTRSALPRMYVGPGSLSDLNSAIQLEWIVTNGLGGYASSTVLNINSRKYHGLLVVAFNPPVDRHILLSKIDEEVQIGNDTYALGSNEFRDTIFPDGYKRLTSFTLNPFPTFSYQVSGIHLKKEAFAPYQKNWVVMHYEVLNSLDKTIFMNVYPLVNARHFYDTTDRHSRETKFIQETIPNGVQIGTQPEEGHLAILSTDGHYTPNNGVWVEKMYFRIDDSRGESCTDDNYRPGFFRTEVPPKGKKEFYVAAIGGRAREDVASQRPSMFGKNFIRSIYTKELSREVQLLQSFYGKRTEIKPEDWLSWLVLSADAFVVRRRSTGGKSVIAGYHWFEDWGRDTLISLPGLTLVTGRFSDAEEILLTFRHYCRDGLLPNRFPDRTGDEPVYDSVDTSLWFFNAVLQYLKYTGKFDFVQKQLWETLRDIVEQHIRGTPFGIRMDEDGLLLHGPRLTWIDASVKGKPVNPRAGKAVEIQALWYNALRVVEMLASRFGTPEEAQRYGSIARNARTSFNEKFWWPKDGYLHDTVESEQGDPSLRPNQVIAACLDFCMLDDVRREKVVDSVWRGLWGTYGLGSLSSADPGYIGRYVGGFDHRDTAYHNGTVWAWLLGPFVTAFLKVKKHKAYWRRFAFEEFLRPVFLEQTLRAGLGTISEIFDGDPPHSPRGCISQAWSVAEPLRAYVEDILLKRPPYEGNLGGGPRSF